MFPLVGRLFRRRSPIQVMTRVLAERRADARWRLDSEPDAVVSDGEVRFRHMFETVEDSETFYRAPADLVESGRRLLTIDAADGVAAAVHNTVVAQIGCNCIPVFAMVNGGRGRSLFTFKCVYPTSPAFLDVRVLPRVDIVKWVLMGVSHSHDFSFHPRLHRNTFSTETLAEIRNMVLQNHSSAEIRMTNGVLCNKDVFYNSTRSARAEMRTDQSRALRDEAVKSDIWSSEIRLTVDNVFREAFCECRAVGKTSPRHPCLHG